MGRFFGRLQYRWSIASLLVLGIALPILAVLVVETALDIQQLRERGRDSFEERGLLLGETLTGLLANPVYSMDVDRVRDIAWVARSQPDVIHVDVFDPQGRLIASAPGDKYPSGAVSSASALDAVGLGSTAVRFTGSALEIASPITAGGEVIGGIQVGYFLEPLEEQTTQAIGGLILQGAVLMTLAVVMAFFVARYLVRPIERLTSSVQAIPAGNLGPVWTSRRRRSFGSWRRRSTRWGANSRPGWATSRRPRGSCSEEKRSCEKRRPTFCRGVSRRGCCSPHVSLSGGKPSFAPTHPAPRPSWRG